MKRHLAISLLHLLLLLFGFLAVSQQAFGASDIERPCISSAPKAKWEEPGQLVNDGFRHRDLHTATFLSRDPAGFIDGPNHYNYVAHNPWSAFDPHGLATTLQIPDGTNDIGYVSITNNDPLLVSAPPDPSQGTVGAATLHGAQTPPRGPPAGHDPVTTAAITNLLEATSQAPPSRSAPPAVRGWLFHRYPILLR